MKTPTPLLSLTDSPSKRLTSLMVYTGHPNGLSQSSFTPVKTLLLLGDLSSVILGIPFARSKGILGVHRDVSKVLQYSGFTTSPLVRETRPVSSSYLSTSPSWSIIFGTDYSTPTSLSRDSLWHLVNSPFTLLSSFTLNHFSSVIGCERPFTLIPIIGVVQTEQRLTVDGTRDRTWNFEKTLSPQPESSS